MEPLHLILLGLVLIVGAGSMIRTQRKVSRSASRDLLDEAAQTLRASRQSVLGELRGLEVRLHEESRDIEARLNTKIAILSRLVDDADDRIRQLSAISESADNDRGRESQDVSGQADAERRAA